MSIMKNQHYSDGCRVYRILGSSTRNEDCAVVFTAKTPQEASTVAQELNKQPCENGADVDVKVLK